MSKKLEAWALGLSQLQGVEFVVLGAKNNAYLQALRSLYPERVLYVIDSEEPKDFSADKNMQLHIFPCAQDLFSSSFFTWLIQHNPMTLTNREAWDGREERMLEMFSHLTGRSAESFRYHLLELGVDVKVTINPGEMASIKNIFMNMNKQDFDKNPSYMIMRELVR